MKISQICWKFLRLLREYCLWGKGLCYLNVLCESSHQFHHFEANKAFQMEALAKAGKTLIQFWFFPLKLNICCPLINEQLCNLLVLLCQVLRQTVIYCEIELSWVGTTYNKPNMKTGIEEWLQGFFFVVSPIPFSFPFPTKIISVPLKDFSLPVLVMHSVYFMGIDQNHAVE